MLLFYVCIVLCVTFVYCFVHCFVCYFCVLFCALFCVLLLCIFLYLCDHDFACSLFSHIRMEKKIDTILEKEPEMLDIIRAAAPMAIHKTDKEGHPVIYMKLGMANIKLLHAKGVTDEHAAFCHAYDMETLACECEKESFTRQKTIEKQMQVIDCHGLSLATLSGLHYVKAMAEIDQKYYPEFLARGIIINAPSIFAIFWNIIKLWLDPVTAAKFAILSTDGKEELRKWIHDDDLPVEYGGNDSFAIPLPRYEFSEKIKNGKQFVKEISCIWSEDECLNGEYGGLTLDFNFVTLGHDICFGAIFVPEDQTIASTVIAEQKRVPSQQYPFDGTHFSAQSGTWILTWDNSYSYFTSKILQYNFSITKVKKTDIEKASKLAERNETEK